MDASALQSRATETCSSATQRSEQLNSPAKACAEALRPNCACTAHTRLRGMADTLQIRNVPEELHEVIEKRARAAGLTISQYLLRRIAQIEGKPEIGEVLDAHWQRSQTYKRASPGTAAMLLAEDRQR